MPEMEYDTGLSCEQRAIELTAELVAIDSVNPGLIPGAAGEGRIIDFLRQRAERNGWRTHVVIPEGHPDRPSLVAVAPNPLSKPVVIFNGHVDTVGTSGMDIPFVSRIEGDRMFGRGTADMKGGIAALVVAAEELVRLDSPWSPMLTFVADEEDSSLGSETVIAALDTFDVHPSLCVIGEPTDLELARSLRGFAVARVSFAGRAAHSSQPERGINAVANLGRFLARVEDEAAAVRSRGGDLMVTVVHGGESPYVIPDAAYAIVERRTVPGETSATFAHDIGSMLRPEWNARVELLATREAWQLDDTGLASQWASALAMALGTGSTFAAPYWMEAPLWQSACPTLICGPSGGGLHAIDEWVDLEQIRRFTRALIDVFSTKP